MSTPRNQEHLYIRIGEKKARVRELSSVVRHCQREIDSVNNELSSKLGRKSHAWRDSTEGKEFQRDCRRKRENYQNRLNDAQSQIDHLERELDRLISQATARG